MTSNRWGCTATRGRRGVERAPSLPRAERMGGGTNLLRRRAASNNASDLPADYSTTSLGAALVGLPSVIANLDLNRSSDLDLFQVRCPGAGDDL